MLELLNQIFNVCFDVRAKFQPFKKFPCRAKYRKKIQNNLLHDKVAQKFVFLSVLTNVTPFAPRLIKKYSYLSSSKITRLEDNAYRYTVLYC